MLYEMPRVWHALFLFIVIVNAKENPKSNIVWNNGDDIKGVQFGEVSEHCGKNRFGDYSEYDYYDQKPLSFLRQLKVGKRIVGGKESRHGEWPWLASLDIKLPSNGSWFQMCGATLIHPKWLVSAAHCFEKYWLDILTNDPTKWRVRLGEHNMFKYDISEKVIGVKKIIVHPERKVPDSMNFDIALIELQKPTKLTEYINVACLPSKKDIFLAGKFCYTAGVGHLKENGSKSKTVRHVKVPLTSHEYCFRVYEELKTHVKDVENLTISDSMICAGYRYKGGKDACQFDSGGPMVCYMNNQWLLTGVVSLGAGCGRAKYPGIYTRVASYLDWIKWIVDANH